MTTNAAAEHQSSATTEAQTRVVGPFPEFDRYGEPTGVSYYECTRCGQPAIYESDLDACCTEGDR
jgi:hypothetical protein